MYVMSALRQKNFAKFKKKIAFKNETFEFKNLVFKTNNSNFISCPKAILLINNNLFN